MDAWRKVKKDTIANCISKCEFNEATLELFIDEDTDAEFAGLQNYISEIPPDSMVDSYLNRDGHAVTSVNMSDICSINWKDDRKEKATPCVIEDDDKTEKQAEAGDDFDIEQTKLKIRSNQAALSIEDALSSFCNIR